MLSACVPIFNMGLSSSWAGFAIWVFHQIRSQINLFAGKMGENRIIRCGIFSVCKQPTEMIVAGSDTPSHQVLHLSEIDLIYRIHMSTYMVYAPTHNSYPEPAKALKEALARVLIQFYPLMGRISKNDQEKYEVICTREGVPFIEAKADCTLQSLDYLRGMDDTQIYAALFFQTYYSPTQIYPATLQVTSFKCGGFVVAIEISHLIFDGEGLSSFKTALANMSRQIINPNKVNTSEMLPPHIWERHLLRPRDPPVIEFPHDERVPGEYYRMPVATKKIFFITQQTLKHLREAILDESQGQLKRCSAFEALAANIWTAYAKATDLKCETFYFVANARRNFQPPIPPGFNGNCIIPVPVTRKDVEDAGMGLGHGTLRPVHVVKAMKSAKAKLGDKYMRSYVDYLHCSRFTNHVMRTALEAAMHIVDWSALKFTPDFGWGPPVDLMLARSFAPSKTFILPSTDKNGTIKVIVVIPQDAATRFAYEMGKFGASPMPKSML